MMKPDDSSSTNNGNMNQIIKQIVHLIKNEDNYKEAARLMVENNFSVDMICRHTYKLSQMDIAKLTDTILNK
jgi:hypothetical protein